MELRSRLPMAARLTRMRLTGERLPLAARFILTEGCPSRCDYCDYGPRGDELSTERWMGLIQATAALGVRRLCFSGGEPLLRKDLGALVDHAIESGMEAELNTSGAGWKRHPGRSEKPSLVEKLSLLKVSLDGPPEVHDAVRGRPGSHDEALALVDAGIAAGTRTVLVCTVTAANVDLVEYVADLAATLGALACFQPLRDWGFFRAGAEDHPGAQPPEPKRLKAAMARLDQGMREGRYRLRHSEAGLAHAATSPAFPPLKCWAGRTFFIVHHDGSMVACDRTTGFGERIAIEGDDVAGALSRLGEIDCSGCAFSGATELNLLMAGRAGVARQLVRLAGGPR